MFARLAATLALAATALAQNSFSINTPASLVQCQPALISWVGGTAPFILATIPGEQTSAAAISTLSSSLSSSPYTWTVDLAAGTYITLKITDATGVVAYSSAVTIQAGSSNSCLNASADTSGLATTGAITTTGSGSRTLSATTSAVATTSTTSVAVISSSISTAPVSRSSMMSMSGSMSGSMMSNGASGSGAAAASGSASSRPSGAAAPGAVAGIPALAAGVLGGLAFLL